jgi:hypothetical protein
MTKADYPENEHMLRAPDPLSLFWRRALPSSLVAGDRHAGIIRGPGGTLWAQAYCPSCGVAGPRVMLFNLIQYLWVCDECNATHGAVPAPQVPEELLHLGEGR